MGSRSLQEGPAPGPDAPFAVGEWTVDPGANELIAAGGGRKRIEPRAMDVLVLLHERRGQVVPTEEIRDRVWRGAAVSGHSVAIVVSDLRRVLGDSARSPRFLETVPKRGYRLRAPAAAAPPRLSRTWIKTAAAFAAVVGAVVAGAAGRRGQDGIDDRYVAEKYFQARQLWSRREPETARRARALLREVIAARPAHAPAHAAMADLYAHKTGEYLGVSPLEAFRAAEAHAGRALALDAGLAEPWVSRALLDFYRDRQPDKALASLARALERDPRLALAWQTRAMVLSATGEYDASLEAIGTAARLDPLSESVRWDRVWILHLARRQDEAMAALEEASVRSPRNLFYEALIEEARGRKRRALDLWLERFARRGVRLGGADEIRRRAERSVPDAYRLLLDQVEGSGAGREVDGILLAVYRLLAGDAAGALAALERFPPEHLWMRAWLHELPVLDPLRGSPRMSALVAREGSMLWPGTLQPFLSR